MSSSLSLSARRCLLSVVCQPTINRTARLVQSFTPRSRIVRFPGWSVFGIDRPNPLIAAESCTNGIFNSLYFMDVQLSLLRIGRRSPRSDILNDLHDRAVYFAVRQFFVSC